MKKAMRHIFNLFFVVLTAVFLYVAKDWNSTTALFPRVVGYPMLVLMIAVCAMDIRSERRQGTGGEGDDEDSDEMDFKTVNCRMAKYFLWLIGFVVLIWAAGIDYAIPIYIFSYMKIEGKYGWVKCGVYAVATTAFITILFQYIFRVAWPNGALFRILDL